MDEKEDGIIDDTENDYGWKIIYRKPVDEVIQECFPKSYNEINDRSSFDKIDLKKDKFIFL